MMNNDPYVSPSAVPNTRTHIAHKQITYRHKPPSHTQSCFDLPFPLRDEISHWGLPVMSCVPRLYEVHAYTYWSCVETWTHWMCRMNLQVNAHYKSNLDNRILMRPSESWPKLFPTNSVILPNPSLFSPKCFDLSLSLSLHNILYEALFALIGGKET